MITIDIVLLFQLCNVLLLLFLLDKFLYKPIRKVMRDREAELASSKQQALDTDREVQEQMARYERQLHDVRAAALAQRSNLLREAREQEAVLHKTARSEAAEGLAQVQAAIQCQEHDAQTLLRDRADSLSRAICEKVLGRRLS
jgi:F-type H+-transporting ATPase subunit b